MTAEVAIVALAAGDILCTLGFLAVVKWSSMDYDGDE